jgi:hypothetical protein
VLHSFANPDGTQRIEDTGPLTKKRMETIDDDIAARSADFIARQKFAKLTWTSGASLAAARLLF